MVLDDDFYGVEGSNLHMGAVQKGVHDHWVSEPSCTAILENFHIIQEIFQKPLCARTMSRYSRCDTG